MHAVCRHFVVRPWTGFISIIGANLQSCPTPLGARHHLWATRCDGKLTLCLFWTCTVTRLSRLAIEVLLGFPTVLHNSRFGVQGVHGPRGLLASCYTRCKWRHIHLLRYLFIDFSLTWLNCFVFILSGNESFLHEDVPTLASHHQSGRWLLKRWLLCEIWRNDENEASVKPEDAGHANRSIHSISSSSSKG